MASPEYLSRKGMPTAVSDLDLHDTIAYTLSPSPQTWRFADGGVESDVVIRPRMAANNGEVCMAAAIAHQGITYQPDFIVGPALADGRLVRVLPDVQGDELGVHAVYPSRKHLSVKVRVLIDYLAEHFATPRW